MVTKVAKQPNGKYACIQTTAGTLNWNSEIVPLREEPNYTWDEFKVSAYYNQGMKNLDKLINEIPDHNIVSYDSIGGEHYNLMHWDDKYPPEICEDCKYYEKVGDIIYPD